MVDVITRATDLNSLKYQATSQAASNPILQAIKSASDKTGVDFSYLLKKACQESSLDPTAKATTSSARGLYQFTQQTWLRMVKSQGANYGLSDAASHITVDSDGIAHVDSKAWKQAILNMRNDPTVSAEMAAELDKSNMTALKSQVGGKLGGTELYLAHFLGAGGACDFLNTMKAAPNTAAADVLPTAASTNSSVFYKADGTPRTLSEIYHHFAQKFSGAGTAFASIIHNVTTASAAPTPTATTTGVATASASYVPHNVVASAGDVMNSYASVLGTARMGSMGSAVPTNYASVTSSTNEARTSSLYATMVLAQMNDSGLKSLSALSGFHDITVSGSADNTKTADKKALAGIFGSGFAG